MPVPADAGLQTLGRLPQPESLLLFARRGRAIDTFNDLKGASVGIGPDGSGTAYLMRQLLENSDLKDLDLKPSNHDLEAQAEMVRDGQLDLAAFVMNANAELIRTLATKYDLEIVAPADIEGLVARDKWLRLGKIPAGFYDVAKPIPATDKLVAQVDTLIMTNACVHRAERVAFLMLLSEEFPNFVRDNPPPVGEVSGSGAVGRRGAPVFHQRRARTGGPIFPLAREPDVARLLDLSRDGDHDPLQCIERLQPLPTFADRRQPGNAEVPAEGARRSRAPGDQHPNASARSDAQDA